jgi:hypothetical protein
MPLAAQEDIGAVLERFHKWAGQQQKPIRELTYEEAVARSHRRIHVEDAPPRPEPAKAAASPAPVAPPPPPIPFPLVKDPPAFEAPTKPSSPSPRKTASSGKKATSGKQPAAATTKPAATRRESAKTASSTKARSGKKVSAGSKTSVGSKPGTAKKEPAKKSVPRTETAAMAEPVQTPQATFEQVLAAQMQPPVVEPPPHTAHDAVSPSTSLAFALTGATSVVPLPNNAPAVHLTMRLAPDEREALRRRASDLGMTPSDYARQCALQMDLLHTELERIQQSQQQASLAPSRTQEDSQPAERATALSLKRQDVNRHAGKNPWLQRLKNFFFPRRVKGQTFAARA